MEDLASIPVRDFPYGRYYGKLARPVLSHLPELGILTVEGSEDHHIPMRQRRFSPSLLTHSPQMLHSRPPMGDAPELRIQNLSAEGDRLDPGVLRATRNKSGEDVSQYCACLTVFRPDVAVYDSISAVFSAMTVIQSQYHLTEYGPYESLWQRLPAMIQIGGVGGSRDIM